MRRIAGETNEVALRELRSAPRQKRRRLDGQQLQTRRQLHAVRNIAESNSLDGLQVRGFRVSCWGSSTEKLVGETVTSHCANSQMYSATLLCGGEREIQIQGDVIGVGLWSNLTTSHPLFVWTKNDSKLTCIYVV